MKAVWLNLFEFFNLLWKAFNFKFEIESLDYRRFVMPICHANKNIPTVDEARVN